MQKQSVENPAVLETEPNPRSTLETPACSGVAQEGAASGISAIAAEAAAQSRRIAAAAAALRSTKIAAAAMAAEAGAKASIKMTVVERVAEAEAISAARPSPESVASTLLEYRKEEEALNYRAAKEIERARAAAAKTSSSSSQLETTMAVATSDEGAAIPRPESWRPTYYTLPSSWKPARPKNAPRVAVMIGVMGLMRYRYKSDFLKMATHQTHESRLAGIRKTLRMRSIFKSWLSRSCIRLNMEVCLLNHWLMKHSVLVMHEWEHTCRRAVALVSFEDDVMGCWLFPKEDLLLMPNHDKGSEVPFLEALYDIQQSLTALSQLNGSFEASLQVTSVDDDIIYWKLPLPCSLTSDPVLMPLNFFKAIFSETCVRFARGSYEEPKALLALHCLQNAVLVLIKFCDVAMTAKINGSALYLAQTMYLCTLYMDYLLGNEKLLEEQVYTHVMARWYLATCYYNAWKDNNASNEHVLETEYEKTKKDFNDFVKELDKIAEGNPTVIRNLHRQSMLDNGGEHFYCIRGHKHFEELKLPPSWNRSTARRLQLAVVRQQIHLQWIMAELVGDKEKKFFSTKLDGQLEDIVITVDAAVQQARLRHSAYHFEDQLVTSNVLKARCCYRRAICNASARMSSASYWSEWKTLDVDMHVNEKNLYSEMQSYYVTALVVFRRNTLTERVREVFADFLREMLNMTIITEVEREEREEGYNDGLSVLTLALRLAVSLWEVDKYLAHREPVNYLVAAYFDGASLIYLAKYRKDRVKESKTVWLNNARYCHWVAALFMRKYNVSPAVLRLHLDWLKPFFTIYFAWKSVNEQQEVRRRLSLLHRLVLTMPVLWEHAIRHDANHRTKYGIGKYDYIYIDCVQFPYSNSDILNAVGEYDAAVVNDLSANVQRVDRIYYPCPTRRIDYDSHQDQMECISESLMKVWKMKFQESTDPAQIEKAAEHFACQVENIVVALFQVLKTVGRVPVDHHHWVVNGKKAAGLIAKLLIKSILNSRVEERSEDLGAVATVVAIMTIFFSIVSTKTYPNDFHDGHIKDLHIKILKAFGVNEKADEAGFRAQIITLRPRVSFTFQWDQNRVNEGLQKSYLKMNEIFFTMFEYLKFGAEPYKDSSLKKDLLKEFSFLMNLFNFTVMNYGKEVTSYDKIIKPTTKMLVKEVCLRVVFQANSSLINHESTLPFTLSTDSISWAALNLGESAQELWVPKPFIAGNCHSEGFRHFPYCHIEQYHLKEELNARRPGLFYLDQILRTFFPIVLDETTNDERFGSALRVFQQLLVQVLQGLVDVLQGIRARSKQELFNVLKDASMPNGEFRLPGVLPLHKDHSLLEDLIRITKGAKTSIVPLTASPIAVALYELDCLLFGGTAAAVVVRGMVEPLSP